MLGLCVIAHAQTLPLNHQTTINFIPVFNKKPLQTNKWYTTTHKDSVKIELVRCYISNIVLYMDNEKVYTEPNSYHLLNIEETSSLQITLNQVPTGNIRYIGFNLGIDSLTNVSGALEGDLDPGKGMYWAWQSGYINLKIEGTSPVCNTRHQAFEFHIGGYLPPHNTLRHVKLKTPKRKSSKLQIKMDLARFFDTISLNNFNSIMTPSKQAMECADIATKMFFTK